MTTAVGIGRLSRSASRIVGKAAAGFHLLRVEAYSQTKTVPAGQNINSGEFSVGGYPWRVKYYPNGRDVSSGNPHDYISLYLQLYRRHKEHNLQAQYKLSILDQAGNVAYGFPAKTTVFKSSRDDHGEDYGHELFIRREDLERREDLIKDDCLTFRCDVGGFTEVETFPLAREDSDDDDGDNASDDEFGLKPDRHHHHGHSGRRRRRPDDKEFVQWCLAQKRVG
jgi:speckle-type POZ protein